MINVSENFKTAMKQPVKEIQAFIDYDENFISDSDDLISFKISCDSGLCKTAMRKLEAKYLGSHNLLGKWVKAGFGVRLPDGDFDLLNYGLFLVTELTETKDTETTSIVAYDKMVNAMTPYQKLDIEYPINLIDYTRVLCDSCNLELSNVAKLGGLGEHTLTDAMEIRPIDITVKGISSQAETPTPTSPIDILSVDNVNVIVNGNENQIPLLHSLHGLPNGVCDVRSYGKNTQNISRRTIDANTGIWHIVEVRENTTLFYVREVFDDMTTTLNNVNILCSHFPAKQIFSIDEIGVYTHGNEYKMIYFSVPNSIGTTIEDIKTWFSNNQVTVQYEMDEPIITETDDAITFLSGDNTVNITANLTPSSVSIEYYQGEFKPMYAWQITATQDADGNFVDLWENIEGITYRDIFQQIAQATASTCIIHDDKVYFKPLTDTGESLTYDNMFKLKLEAIYGEINSVVLGDNIYMQNEASVETNGLTEVKIENNEIIDKDRENAITPIFDALNGVSYYPFEATTEGLGWYEIGDNITIVNDLGEEFKTSLFNYSITIDGSVKETLKTTAESKTQTQYQYASTITKQLKNTEFIVNKQDQYIKSLVKDMYEEDGVVNEKLTSIKQDIENIAFNIQNSGGSNLIKNSVMFAYDNENKPYNWELEGDGTLTIVSDVDFQTSGGISAHGFLLSNKTVRTEKIPVKPFSELSPVYYSFSTKIKKDSAGSCYVKIYNPDVSEEYTINLAEGETSNLEEHELSALKPLGDYYIIEFYGSADSNTTFTDNMLSIGEQKSQWTQANGEVMNTQVNISLDGIVVRSDTVLGDYTVISKYEFAGYSNINGTMTKVFTLNKGTTEVKKLLVKDEITMAPLKIVPVNSGDMQGWAFVLA